MADSEQVSTKTIADITEDMSKMSLLSFRKIDDVKKLARHFQMVYSHPLTQKNPVILKYIKNMDELNRKSYLLQRNGVEVEYIFTPETKSSLQRQRFNSLPISEVSELLKSEFPLTENSEKVHICTDCNIAIDINDDEPLMESLQKHFNLEVHMPKFKRDSIDVNEPINLPNMSRRLSSMPCGDNSATEIVQLIKPGEKMDRLFLAKLEASLIISLPNNSEKTLENSMKFYQEAFDKLCQEMAGVDFASLTGSVAPIIMSIRDNVNQNFATDANKNFENDESEQTSDRPVKNQIKKYRYYGPIENGILSLLNNHKLLPLVDDRTGKPAFFCVACEYYTLRFRYDSVLNHVFSETHVNNLACILQADRHIPFITEERSVEKVKDVNRKFLQNQNLIEDRDALYCSVCKITIDMESAVIHVLDENHLSKMSDKLFRKFRSDNPNGTIPDDWGQKNLDWAKYLSGTGKPLSQKDPVVIENFIRPSSKIANYCPCCDSTLKGPRQILFNHIRQKKHLRNAAPHKLARLYKNYARPVEYYAGFGNYYVCTLCPTYEAHPSFAGIVGHIESENHFETIARLIRNALFPDEFKDLDQELLAFNKINTKEMKCEYCDVAFQDMHDAILHVLSNIEHQNMLAEVKNQSNKGDIISIYMKGNYILHSEGIVFTCVICKCIFNSIRALLTHLIYADHFIEKLSYENTFRFYLELKHNVNLLIRNKYVYAEFGKLICGVCDALIEEGENAKKHVGNARHRENMGASYINISLDTSANE